MIHETKSFSIIIAADLLSRVIDHVKAVGAVSNPPPSESLSSKQESGHTPSNQPIYVACSAASHGQEIKPVISTVQQAPGVEAVGSKPPLQIRAQDPQDDPRIFFASM